MFLNELIEDYTFEDIKFVYDNDNYFLYVKERYDLSDIDEINFNKLVDSVNHDSFENNLTSLEVISLRKYGFLSRVELVDVEDERRDLVHLPYHELVGYPVDMHFSSDNKRALRLLISLLLEYSYYKDMDNLNKKKSI